MMKQEIEYADMSGSHIDARKTYILALINNPTDAQRRAAIKARIRKALEEKHKQQYRKAIQY